MKTLIAFIVLASAGYQLADMSIGKVVRSLDHVKDALKIKI